jgi:hypothetical protein
VIILKMKKEGKRIISAAILILFIAVFWALSTCAAQTEKKDFIYPTVTCAPGAEYIPTTLDLEAIGITETTTEIVTETTTEVATTKAPSTRAQTTETVTEATTKSIESTTQPQAQSSNFGRFKSYTDYRMLSRSSAQWKLQEQAYTDENGLRKIGDAYLVAMGSYYGKTLGTKYQVTLSSGSSFTVMLCDFKSDRHTDAAHQVCTTNGSVIEFYVDTNAMPSIVRQMGSVGALDKFSGGIVSIEKIA